MARYIAAHDSVRLIVRGLLLPVVFTVAYPWQALLILVLLSALLYKSWGFMRAKSRQQVPIP